VTLPVNVRLTSLTGSQQTLTISDYSKIEKDFVPISNSVQFPSSGSTAGPSTPPPTTPPPSTPPPTTPPPSTPPPTTPPPSTPPPTTPPPSTPKPTPASCSYGSGTNEYWIEVNTGVNGGQTVSVVCADGRAVSCKYQYDKYTCQVEGPACKANRKAYINGACCSIDAGTCTASAVEEVSTMEEVSSQGKVTLTPGILVGILLGAAAITALVVGVIAYKLLKRPGFV